MLSELRREKIESMRRAYPSLRVVSSEDIGSLIWEGWLQAIRSTDELDALLDDLDNDRPVNIVRGELYELRHDRECQAIHAEHRLRSEIKEPIRLFRLRVEDFGDKRVPQARVLEPSIPRDERRHNFGPDGICGFAPWEHPWNPDVSQIVDSVDHSLIWLFKQTVYSQSKHWLGSETPHSTEFLLRTIKPAEPCYCGSGKNYADCHRAVNRNELYGDARGFFEAWLSAYKLDLGRFELSSDCLRRLFSSTNVRAKRA
jgi:SEC-C motif-containing protein